MKNIITGLAVIACFAVACSDPKPAATTTESGTTTEEPAVDSAKIYRERNKLTAMKSNEGYNNNDADAICMNFTSDYTEYGNGEYPAIKGVDTVKANLKMFLAAFKDFKVTDMHAVADGDTVVVTANWTGTFVKEFMGIKPTNKTFKVADADIFIFNKEGKITSHRAIQSEATYFSQLGITMPEKK